MHSKHPDWNLLRWIDLIGQKKSFTTESHLTIYFPTGFFICKTWVLFKKCLAKQRDLNQGHTIYSSEYEPGPLTDQFSSLYLCSVNPKLHADLLI